MRVGDVYSLIIEFHATRQRWKQAYGALQEMRETIPEASIRYYVNPNLLMAIHRELNIEYKIPEKQPEAFSSSKPTPDQSHDNDDIRDNVDYGTYDD